MRIEVAPDASLYCNDWGSGRPVVLIHGWPLDADMWEHQSVHLADNGCRVVAYDRRGFGRSDQPWSGYDYDTFADDLKAVMDRLDLRDVVLVGFSMGGGEVARYMSRHGGARVAKTVLVSAVTPFLLKRPDNPDGVDRSTFEGMVEGLRKDRPHFLTSFGKAFYGAGMLNFSVSSEQLQWSANVAMMASPKATIECVRAFSETDFRPNLTTFRVPRDPRRQRCDRAGREERAQDRDHDRGVGAEGLWGRPAWAVLHPRRSIERRPAGVRALLVD